MSTGEQVRIDDIVRALIAAGITDPQILRTSVAIAARESLGPSLSGTGSVESDLPETEGSASTWVKGGYNPNAVGHGVFQFTPGNNWATNPMHPNMDGWTLQQQIQYFVDHYASQRDFSPWTYNPAYAAQVTSPDSNFVKAANAAIDRVTSGQGQPPLAQSTAAIADKAAQVLGQVPAPAPSAAPPPASPVAPLPAPPQGNAPMPDNRTPFQTFLLEGTHGAVYGDKNGVLSTYNYPLPDGTEVPAYFLPDGTIQQKLPDGDPKAGEQYNYVKGTYASVGHGPDFGGIQVVHGTTENGSDTYSLAPGEKTLPPGTSQALPAGKATGTASAAPSTGIAQAGAGAGPAPANPQAVGPPTDATAGGTGAGSAAPPNARAVAPPGLIPGTTVVDTTTPQALANAQRQGLVPPPPAPPPRPVGLIPNAAIPPPTGLPQADVVSDYLRKIAVAPSETSPGGAPFYAGNAARIGGYPVLVSNAPGSVSIATPQGGIGFNPLAIQDAERGLSSFGLPPQGAVIPQAMVKDLQDNPYGANNPLEQARLSGGLVKDLLYQTNGNGQTTAQYGYAHGGGLTLNGPATLIDNATGRPIASFVDSRNQTPETLYDHGGSVSILNRPPNRGLMPDDPMHGMIRRYDLGGELDFGGTTSYQGNPTSGANATTNATPAASTSDASTAAPVTGTPTASFTPVPTPAPPTPIASNPTTPTAPTDYRSILAGLSNQPLPAFPGTPGVIAPRSAEDQYGANAANASNAAIYARQLAQYENALNGAYTGTASQIAAARQGLAQGLIGPDAEAQRIAIANEQRNRDAVGYKYPAAGVPHPTLVLPPLGQNGLTGGNNLGVGLQYALLTPEQQYDRMNSTLGSLESSLAARVNAAKAQAKAAQDAYLDQLASVIGSQQQSPFGISANQAARGLVAA